MREMCWQVEQACAAGELARSSKAGVRGRCCMGREARERGVGAIFLTYILSWELKENRNGILPSMEIPCFDYV